MKNIKHYLVISLMLAVGAVTVLTATPVSALTKTEKQSCSDTWEGKILDTQKKKDAFNSSNCSKSGFCIVKSSKQVEESGKPVTVQQVTCDKDVIDGNMSSNSAEGPVYENAPNCGDLQTSGIIKCNTDTDNPILGLLLEIINFLAVGVGIAVVGGIVWGGMLYASSNGDSSKAKQGITTIVNSVLGLLLFMFTYALINFLVPGGLFN